LPFPPSGRRCAEGVGSDRYYDAATIRQAVRDASPNLEERKRGHVDDYVERPVEAALEAQARRVERERSRDRGSDLER
jgi:hypothetical protein